MQDAADAVCANELMSQLLMKEKICMHNPNVTFCKCSTIKATYTEEYKLLKFNTSNFFVKHFFVIVDFK